MHAAVDKFRDDPQPERVRDSGQHGEKFLACQILNQSLSPVRQNLHVEHAAVKDVSPSERYGLPGSSISTISPPSGRGRAWSVPPCAMTIDRTIARPSPTPPRPLTR